MKMVKHIVLFRFRDNLSADVRTQAADSFRKGIMELKKSIPTIQNIEVGINMNHNEQWDICLNGEFKTLQDVIEYGKNPLHINVANILKPLISERSCVDYETEQD